jgi:hypothetical protein
MPFQKSRAATVRSPPGPRTTRVASRASSTVGMSEAGSEWATVPPTVPRWRTCGSPTSPAVWARIGHSRSSSSEK